MGNLPRTHGSIQIPHRNVFLAYILLKMFLHFIICPDFLRGNSQLFVKIKVPQILSSGVIPKIENIPVQKVI